jgi:hypothetical protein
MQGALSPVLAVGPEFLAGRLHADDMAQTMVRAVQGYARQEQERQSTGAGGPEVASNARVAEQLEQALIEVYTCGSGYLAARCDSDCVVRTMTQIMNEFGGTSAAR